MKKPLSFLRLLTLLLAVIWVTPSLAQISAGGTPPSFKYEEGQMTLKSAKKLPIDFDVKAMRIADVEREAAGMPPHVGKIIPVDNLTTENSGEWTTLPDGQRIWRLTIEAKDAIAIMLTYDKFEIPAGGKLFIYNADRSRVLGAYTEVNNPKRVEYATEFVSGDQLTLEYVAPKGSRSDSPIVLTGVVYGYNHLYFESPEGGPSRISFGASGACMVNVNCPEGDNWKDEKQGVTRIVTATGGGYYALCSGTVLNNTARNLDPLFLSAFHCYEDLTAAQINQSIYYFKYEHPTCTGRSDPTVPTVTGATMLANIPMNGGSDGSLLRLNESIPLSYGVYFNGWDRRNTPATSGVGIHHPNADVKKISTYTQTAQSTGNVSFQGGAVTAPNSEWLIYFAQTTSGWGVTEGGSSGSPMFDQNHRVVGTLSGGNSSCDNTSGRNIYGKLWYHWDQYSNSSQWMKPHLDPLNTGEEFIEGTYEPGTDPVAGFRANKTNILASEFVTFTDASAGATTWEWLFPGGTPSSYSGQEPPAIQYNTQGTYSVTLTINKGTDRENAKTETDYIKVTLKQKECANEKEIGTGTAVSQFPFGASQRQTVSSSIYTAAELGNVGGAITKLAWNASVAGGNPRSLFTIYMKEVDGAEQTTSTYANEIAGATVVFALSTTNVSYWTNDIGWNEITLNTPFQYSGTKNLKIIVREYTSITSPYTSSGCYYSTATNAHMQWTATNTNNPTGNGTINSNRPNIKITINSPCGTETLKADFATVQAFSEDFESPGSLPAGWAIETIPTTSTGGWSPMYTGLTNYSFAGIDPNSPYSIVMAGASSNFTSSLKTPEIALGGNGKAEFYLLYNKSTVATGRTELRVSDDGGVNWTTVWTTGSTNEGASFMKWRKGTADLSAYANKTVQLAWVYIATGASTNLCLDGVKITSEQSPIRIFEGQTASFTDLSQGPPVSWEWSLPGSQEERSIEQSPTGRYMKAGSYSASLKVTNNTGSDSKTVNPAVIVSARTPKADFMSYSNALIMQSNSGQFLPLTGGPVLYEDLSDYYPTSWAWTLPGATPATSNEQEPMVQYPAGANTYSATLVATNAAGASTVTKDSHVQVGGTAEVWNVLYGESPTMRYTANYAITGADLFTNTAERFEAPAAGEITKVRIYTQNVSQTSSSSMTVAIYSDNNGVPGTPISPILYVQGGSNRIVNGGYMTFTFPNPVGVSGTFHVVVGSTNYNTTLFTVPSTEERDFAYGTVSAYYQGSWFLLEELFEGLYISMNIIPEFTYTTAELTSDDAYKRKDVDPTVGTVTFTSTGHSWAATADSWITLSASTGTIDALGNGSFTFTCQDNTTPAVRRGKITANVSGIPCIINVVQGGSYPENFVAKYDDEAENILLTWGQRPPEPGQDIFDNIESHTSFELNSAGVVGWNYIDGDGATPYALSNDGETYPNANEPCAYIVYDPSQTTPPTTDAAFAAHSGNKYFGFLANIGGTPNNDWLISPELAFPTEFKFVFWAKSTLSYYPETMNVKYSTGGKAQADFANSLSSGAITVPASWTKYEYTVPADAKYVAINCTSVDMFILAIDDIFIGTGDVPAPPAPVAPAGSQNTITKGTKLTKKAPVSAVSVSISDIISAKEVTPVQPTESEFMRVDKALPATGAIKLQNNTPANPIKQKLGHNAVVVPFANQMQNSSGPDKASSTTLRWDNDTPKSIYGNAGGSPVDMEVAIRFAPEDLVDYSEITINSVMAYLYNDCDALTLKISQGSNVYTQPVSSFEAGARNTFTLTTPFVVDLTKDLYVGYTYTQHGGTDAQEVYVPVADAGPAVAGKGNLFASNGGELAPSLDGNWILAANVTVETGAPPTYTIFRVDKADPLATGLIEQEYRDLTGVINKTYCYQITATYLGDDFFTSEKSPEECVFVKSPLRVTADNKQMRENDTPPALTATPSGELLDGDQYADVISYSLACAVDQSTVAGTYPIVVVAESLDLDKYVVKGVEGIMTVNVYETVIGTQPVGGTVCTGSNFTFTVVMADGLEVTYQWQKETNGAWHNISGANQPSYTINNVTPDDAGLYRVLLSGRTSVVVSEPALLKVALSPASIVVYEWNNVPTINCNSATNGGYTFVAFQWYKGTTPIGNKPYITKDAGATDCEITCSDGRIFRLCNFTNPVSDAVLTAYPNPVTEGQNITVSLTNAPQGSIINIYNLNGGLVKGNIPMTGSESSVNINGFMPGMYVIQVSSPDGIKHTTKIVVK